MLREGELNVYSVKQNPLGISEVWTGIVLAAKDIRRIFGFKMERTVIHGSSHVTRHLTINYPRPPHCLAFTWTQFPFLL